MNYIAIFLIGLFILQCGKKEVNNLQISSTNVKISIDPLKAQKFKVEDAIKDYSYLKLDIPDSLYFSSIEKILFDDGNIYMLDKSNFQDQILSFDVEGNFIFHINKPGRGPGEFESIYDFDVEGNNVLLSTPTGLKFYDKTMGTYLKTIPSSKGLRIQNFKMLDSNLLVTEVGRFKSNTSKKQVKILDLEHDEIIREGVSFESHALKGSHSNRYLFNYDDTLSVLPMYDQTVYRVFEDNSGVNIKAAYKLDFGEYWVNQDLLESSYSDMDAFFKEIGSSINVFDVFETDQNIYVDYKYSGVNYAHIYDKENQTSKNVREFSNNQIGWLGTPVATNGSIIINTLTAQKILEHGLNSNYGEFEHFFPSYNEQNVLVLIFVELK